MAENLLDAVLTKVSTISRKVVAAAAAAATAASAATPNDRGVSTAGTAAVAVADVGELCAAVRAYCEVVSLGRPAAIRARHLHAATSAPIDALEAVISAFCQPPAADKAAVPRESPWTAAAAVVARLEEVALCSVLMTTGGVAVAGLESGGAAGGAGGGGGKKSGGGREDSGVGNVALGVDADDGVRQCASALRRLVLLGLSAGKSGRGGGGDGGGDDGSSKSSSSNGYGCCCAGLYVALLLRGSRFEAVAEVVGDMLGARTAPPPLTGPNGMDALEALRDAAVAASESEFPCPPSSSSSSASSSPRLRPSFTSPRPASAAALAASSSSPSVSPRGGPVSSKQRGAAAAAAVAAVPPLSLSTAVPASSSSASSSSRVRPRSWSMGSGGGAGAETSSSSAAAAAAAAATSLAEENRAAAAASAGGAGWFSEAALADYVTALSPCAGAGLGPVESATPAAKTATASGAAAVARGGERWRYCPVDCVEEALEQVRCQGLVL